MISFLHISDFHLVDNTHSDSFYFDEKRENAWRALNNAIDFANENKIKYILVTGDMYERRYFNDSHVKRLKSIFKRFNGRVVIIAGNHDYFANKSEATRLSYDNIFVFYDENRLVFPDDELTIYGYSWKDEIYKDNIDLSEVHTSSKYNIVMLHSGTEIDEAYLPLDISVFDDNIDYIALGHIHKPISLSEKAAYAGSIEPLNIKETGIHGGIYGTINDRLDLKYIRFQETEYLDISMDITDLTVDDIVFKLKERVNDLDQILRLSIKGMMNALDPVDIRLALSKYFKIVKIIDNRTVLKENMVGDEFNYIFEKISELDKNIQEDVKRQIFKLLNEFG
ncbi:MAG: metallophosphoesterase [Ezakiella sp.]|nr:metallophosphoesterase [Ezakiella sp.]